MERKQSTRGPSEQDLIKRSNKLLNNISVIEKADSGNYEEAINDFDKIIRLNPDDESSYFARATLKVRLGDIEGARQDFKLSELCRRKEDTASKNYPLV